MFDMIRSFVQEHKYQLLAVLVASALLTNLFCVYWIVQTQKSVEKKFEETNGRIGQLSNQVDNLSANIRTLLISDKDKGKPDKAKEINIAYTADFEYYFDEYTDLRDFPEVSTEQLDYILSRWSEVTGGNNNFAGLGSYFMAASLRSGYNPIYLIAHAAVESGWGTSHLALYYGNLFGIGAYSYDSGYYVADSIAQGIVNGSIWINSNFYLNGYTSLRSMKDAGYASDGSWEYNIVSIVRDSYVFLKEANI